jgi:hypothetical protein
MYPIGVMWNDKCFDDIVEKLIVVRWWFSRGVILTVS